MIGRTIGNYVVRAKVGEGGMGVVYKAEHPHIHRRVAIKVLHPGVDRNPEVVHRFFNEAKAATNIGDDHIVEVLDFGELPEGPPYLVMEWLEGQSLGDLLREQPRQPLARTAAVVRGIAQALKAAHGKGVIHRDLKPDNVFLVERHGDRDFVKVLDFGIAKLIQSGDVKHYQTQTGAIIGTPAYMSPEQCRGAKDIDTRTDVYSLGVIAYQMLTGRLPFTAVALGELLFQHLTEQPPPPASLQPDVPQVISAIVSGTLEKEPDRRPTLEELGAAMETVLPLEWSTRSMSGVVAAPISLALSNPALSRPSRAPLSVAGDRSRPFGAALNSRASAEPGPSSTTLGASAAQLHSERPLPKSRSGRVLAVLLVGVASLATVGFVLVRKTNRQPPGEIARHAEPTEPRVVRAPVRVQIRTEPGGARLELDGRSVENPFVYQATEANPRLHQVTARMPGFVSLRQSLAFDRDRDLLLTLAPESPGPRADDDGDDDRAAAKNAPQPAGVAASAQAVRESRPRKVKTPGAAAVGAGSSLGVGVGAGAPAPGYKGSKLKIETDFP